MLTPGCPGGTHGCPGPQGPRTGLHRPLGARAAPMGVLVLMQHPWVSRCPGLGFMVLRVPLLHPWVSHWADIPPPPTSPPAGVRVLRWVLVPTPPPQEVEVPPRGCCELRAVYWGRYPEQGTLRWVRHLAGARGAPSGGCWVPKGAASLRGGGGVRKLNPIWVPAAPLASPKCQVHPRDPPSTQGPVGGCVCVCERCWGG